MLEEPLGEEERVNPDSPEPDVSLELEEDEPPEASWVTKGNKRQKTMHIPKVKKRTLQIFPGRSQYFVELRQSYTQDRIIAAENTLIDLELAAVRLDDRIIQAQKFI